MPRRPHRDLEAQGPQLLFRGFGHRVTAGQGVAGRQAQAELLGVGMGPPKLRQARGQGLLVPSASRLQQPRIAGHQRRPQVEVALERLEEPPVGARGLVKGARHAPGLPLGHPL